MNPCASLCRDDRVGLSFPPFLPSFCFNKSSLLLRLICSFVSTKSPSPRLNHAEPSLVFHRAFAFFPLPQSRSRRSPFALFSFPNRALSFPQWPCQPFLAVHRKAPLRCSPCFFPLFPFPYNIKGVVLVCSFGFSVRLQLFCIFLQKSRCKIWWLSEKAVPLHSLSKT